MPGDAARVPCASGPPLAGRGQRRGPPGGGQARPVHSRVPGGQTGRSG